MSKVMLTPSNVLFAAVLISSSIACSKKEEPKPAVAAPPPPAATTAAEPVQSAEPPSTPPESSASPDGPWGSASKEAGISGTLTISEPVKICKKSGLGKATLKWEVTGAPGLVEVHVSKPDGALLARTGKKGTATTGLWASKGSVFFLQNGAEGVPRTLEHTIAKAQVESTVDGPCE